MKTILLIFCITLISSNCLSQIIENYPFKTFLDEENNLYVSGNKFNSATNSIDILTEKYNSHGNNIYSEFFPNISGTDKGLDIDIDDWGNAFITGFIFNNLTNSNEIIIISLNPDGTTNWSKIYSNPGDDKGMGIDISLDNFGVAENVYISGYISNLLTGKDFIVKKLDAINGDSLWQSTFTFPGDQVATDIIMDAGYAYVVGYTYGEGESTSDIMIQSYDKQNGGLHDNHVYQKAGSNEKPTGFCVPFPSGDPISKSRSAITSITDEIINNNVRTSYLTVCFDPDLNNDLAPKWVRETMVDNEFSQNIPTAITSDYSGDIYVTGYMYNPMFGAIGSAGYDFATVKYSQNTGGDLWNMNPLFINYNDTSSTGVDDKATSIKVNDEKRIFIAGTSQGSPNGYSIAVIDQHVQNPNPVERYKKPFVPNFLSDGRTSDDLNKWATLEMTSDGTPIMIVMGWNETEAHWAAVKYDQSGNVEYTINNEPETSSNAVTKNSETPKLISVKNYPNPFNPATQLEFRISELGFVTLKVYDMMGREVETLVNESKNAGSHTVTFDGRNLSSGVYYYTISIGGIRMETKSMMMMK